MYGSIGPLLTAQVCAWVYGSTPPYSLHRCAHGCMVHRPPTHCTGVRMGVWFIAPLLTAQVCAWVYGSPSVGMGMGMGIGFIVTHRSSCPHMSTSSHTDTPQRHPPAPPLWLCRHPWPASHLPLLEQGQLLADSELVLPEGQPLLSQRPGKGAVGQLHPRKPEGGGEESDKEAAWGAGRQGREAAC